MDDQNAWEVTVEHGTKRQIRNCRDFLAVAKSSFDVQTEDDWSTLQAAGARCLALDALRSAKAASRTFLGWFTLSPESIARLPPSLDMPDAPESVEDAERAERACKPWGRYDHTLKVEVETGDRALLHTAGWSGRLTLYARADFNGDGIEDLMVRRDAHVDHGGTAADSTVFIVTQTSPRRCLHLVRALGADPADGTNALGARAHRAGRGRRVACR
jgi:hypothetical protein